MAETSVRVEGVGKRYRLGVGRGDDGLLSDRLERALRRPFRAIRRGGGSEPRPPHSDQDLWALRDVSLEIEPGEVLGLVGANGAGKSTLLKLLSRITLPTEGRIEMRGRVGTLLEVGTGFHPELTGRENVFLNGAILGMRRQEIARRYDEIVEFSGVERFLETPVKRYSSGMYVRLAFAVAAHLEPEILLVDEVLSVGDAEFQRKCLGKMRDVAGHGRTVVFVSHNLNSVQRLCSRAVLIEGGRLTADGPPESVVSKYLAAAGPDSTGGTSIVPDAMERIGTGEAKLRRVTMRDPAGTPVESVYAGQPFELVLGYEVSERVERVAFEIGISTLEGEQVATVQSIDGDRPPIAAIEPGEWEIAVRVPVTLLPHEFNLDVAMHRMSGITVDHVAGAHRFVALNMDEEGGDSYRWPTVRGYVRPDSEWSEPRLAQAPNPAARAASPAE